MTSFILRFTGYSLAGMMFVGGLSQISFAEEQTDKSEKGVFVKVPSAGSDVFIPASAPVAVTTIQHEAALSDKASGVEETSLHFEIRSYTLDGATLLSKEEIDRAVSPYLGKNKNFTDIQRALEAVDELYLKNGYAAVHVSLPEQELEQGAIHFHVIESRFGAVTVKNNKFIKYISDANALNALPSVRKGKIPRSKQIARELKFANENPVRQLNVVLKAGDKDEELDANIIVTDNKPGAWGTTLDNTGSTETGRTRLGLSYRHANLFDKDHIGSLQVQVSPEQMQRVKVIGGSYKIPFYQWGGSAEFTGGYSNVNAVVSGASIQGGGLVFSARYNRMLEHVGVFDPRLSFGIDWRDFNALEITTPSSSIVSINEIVVMPVNLSYAAQGKTENADLGFNTSLAANLPGVGKGKRGDFACYVYDAVNSACDTTVKQPDAYYKVVRYGGNYAQPIGRDWQLRAAFNGQWSGDVLIQGEQMRLGGADGVRGFSEGSEGGEKGMRGNLEGYTPEYTRWKLGTRALLFYDAGQATGSGGTSVSIASYGVGVRSSYANKVALRADVGRILKAGADPLQQAGNWRAHLALSASF